MNKEDCFLLGYITKLHGYKGSLMVFMDVDNPLEYQELESVLIDIDNKLIPFFISKIELKPGSNNAVVRLKDIDTVEAADKFVKKSLYLPLSFLPKLDGKKFYFHEVIGFEIIDVEYGTIGTIKTVIDLPNNPLLSVDSQDNKEILVPAIDEFILSINRVEKSIKVNLPEGLIDLYVAEKSREE